MWARRFHVKPRAAPELVQDGRTPDRAAICRARAGEQRAVRTSIVHPSAAGPGRQGSATPAGTRVGRSRAGPRPPPLTGEFSADRTDHRSVSVRSAGAAAGADAARAQAAGNRAVTTGRRTHRADPGAAGGEGRARVARVRHRNRRTGAGSGDARTDPRSRGGARPTEAGARTAGAETQHPKGRRDTHPAQPRRPTRPSSGPGAPGHRPRAAEATDVSPPDRCSTRATERTRSGPLRRRTPAYAPRPRIARTRPG